MVRLSRSKGLGTEDGDLAVEQLLKEEKEKEDFFSNLFKYSPRTVQSLES